MTETKSSTLLTPLTPPNLTREQQLLLSCAAITVSSGKSQQIRMLVQEGIDWNQLAELGMQHRVLPLLYQNLSRICPDLVPQPWLLKLKAFFSSNARRALLLSAELIRLIAALGERGIGCIPFKGPILASYAYGNLTLRQFDDIDILVPRDQILPACELLEAQNFRLRSHFDRTRLEQYLAMGWAFTFDRADDLVTVDLHWAFNGSAYSFPFERPEMWNGLSPVSVAGRTLMTLPLEETLLLNSVHGAKHEWERLEWICSLSAMMETHASSINWDRVLAQAQQLRGERMLLLAVRLANGLLGAEIPKLLSARISRDSRLEKLFRQVQRGLFETMSPDVREAGRYAFHMLMRESWRDRARYFSYFSHRQLMPSARDTEMFPVRGPLGFLRYLSRPFRLLRDYRLDPVAEFLRRIGFI